MADVAMDRCWAQNPFARCPVLATVAVAPTGCEGSCWMLLCDDHAEPYHRHPDWVVRPVQEDHQALLERTKAKLMDCLTRSDLPKEDRVNLERAWSLLVEPSQLWGGP